MKIKLSAFFATLLLSTLTHALIMPDSDAPDFEQGIKAVVPQGESGQSTEIEDNFNWSDHLRDSDIGVILISYPKNCTYICPTELRTLETYVDRLSSEGWVPMVISSDPAASTEDNFASGIRSHETWRTMDSNPQPGDEPIGIGQTRYIMIGDPEEKVLRQFGFVSEHGETLRCTVFILKNKKVMISGAHNNSIGRDFDEILANAQKIKELQNAKPNHVIPANWKHGDKLMEATHSAVRVHLMSD